MLKKYDLLINGSEFEIVIEELGYTSAKVKVNGNVYDVELKPEEQVDLIPKLVRSTAPSPTVAARQPVTTSPDKLVKSNVVTAPMPGLILDVKVREGDTVKQGDLLLKMEAMKMENEIRSPINGSISEIRVKSQQDVLEGDVLIVLAQ